eukprot:SM000017S02883  [mRNA]  locus=s17:918328:927163:+ [translate_table: standard]
MGAGPAGAYAAYGQAPGAAYWPPRFGGFPAPQAAPYGYGALAAVAAPAADPNQAAAGDAPSGSDWQEATAQDGRKYYYNRRTRQSSWEKPPEMMTAQERADASAIWKEFTTPDGRKYYYNKVTKQSKWTMPDEMKQEKGLLPAPAAGAPAPLATTTPVVSMPSAAISASLLAAAPAAPQSKVEAVVDKPVEAASPLMSPKAEPVNGMVSGGDLEEAKKGMVTAGKINVSPAASKQEKPAAPEPLTFATKQEAKTSFKELLEAHHIGSDATWDQTMRQIANNKRYSALKTLGERKQAFNEYIAQRKKQEVEEKRLKVKRSREEFLAMLSESKALTSSMRWSKAQALFENDPRCQAVEKERDREELYEDYLVDLERKEKDRAREDRKHNQAEYRAFLETCDFVKVNTQWRKVQDRLEDDERCARLDKIDRLEVFQEYIRDLEKREEEEKQIAKEALRRKERKNRDEFRKVLADDRASGELHVRTRWRDYLAKVKEMPSYEAVAGNASGSTPKELFEDVIEELEKQYQDDKAKVKEVMKTAKVVVTPVSSFDAFRDAVKEAGDLEEVSAANLKLVFGDFVERAKEKEEKEAKRKRRIAGDFAELLHETKSITATSTWEDAQVALADAPEYTAFTDEAERLKVFQEHQAHLQAKVKEKERKREREKEKEREKGKEQEKEREREERAKEKEKEKEKAKEKDRESKKEKERKDKDKEKKREKEKVGEKDKAKKDAEGGKGEERKRDKEREHKEHREKDKDREGDKGKDKEKERREEKRLRKRHARDDDEADDSEDGEDGRKPRKHNHRSSDRKKSRKHAEPGEEGYHNGAKVEAAGAAAAEEAEVEEGEVFAEDGEIP